MLPNVKMGHILLIEIQLGRIGQFVGHLRGPQRGHVSYVNFLAIAHLGSHVAHVTIMAITIMMQVSTYCVMTEHIVPLAHIQCAHVNKSFLEPLD